MSGFVKSRFASQCMETLVVLLDDALCLIILAKAIATLRRALENLQLSLAQRQGFVDMLDEWTHRFAYGDIEVETHDGAGDVLQRNIYQVADEKPALLLFETGMGFPQRRELPVEFKKPRPEFDFQVEHRNIEGDPEQTSLGTFTVREIDSSALDSAKVRIILHLDEKSRLGMSAVQGNRKLEVTWSLIPPPRPEPADA